MNQRLKQRITKLNNGEIPEGYKKTEFGVFPCDWESKKMENIAILMGGGTPSRKNDSFWTGDIPWISSSDVSEDNISKIAKNRHITKEAVKKSATKIVPPNSILVVSRVGVGKLAINKNEVCTSQDFTNLTEIKENVIYSAYALKNHITHEISKSQGTSIKGISSKEIKKYTLQFPSFNEQNKIAEILMKWDELITLQERMLEALQKQKKYYLSKMFPSKGQSVPEIRFAGFTDPWEQRKLYELVEFVRNGYNYTSDGSREHKYKITRIESISTGTINSEKLGSSEMIDEKYRLINGDILFSHINSLSYMGNHALYTDNMGEIYHGMNLLCIRSNMEKMMPSFLACALKTDALKSYIQSHAKPAVSQCSLPTSDLNNMPMLVPQIQEQRKISDYFTNLDDLITLHQRQLEKVREQKKTMMQLLLTGIVRV